MEKHDNIIEAVNSFLERIKECFNGDNQIFDSFDYIQECLNGDNRTFDSFHDILERYKRQKISADKVFVEAPTCFIIKSMQSNTMSCQCLS